MLKILMVRILATVTLPDTILGPPTQLPHLVITIKMVCHNMASIDKVG